MNGHIRPHGSFKRAVSNWSANKLVRLYMWGQRCYGRVFRRYTRRDRKWTG